MVDVTLGASLAGYLPDGDESSGRRSVALAADTWPDTVREIRSRFEKLGERLFDESGRLRSGFVVAVNDEVSRGPDGPRLLGPGDRLYVFAQIAGG
ncbi:MAG: MoaD/ThiS family protein [Saccharothrix sp.]|nr:MoaD/ThiS family protein [Saccharothrix sp.]